MIYGIFEISMLLCFAFAWPFSIYKSMKTKTAKGKSLLFMMMLIIGYLFGILNKFVVGDINYVLFFYFVNTALVTIDTLLYFRNVRLDRKRDSGASGS